MMIRGSRLLPSRTRHWSPVTRCLADGIARVFTSVAREQPVMPL